MKVTMPRTPKSPDEGAPKKRTRKTTIAAEDGIKVVGPVRPASKRAAPKAAKSKAEEVTAAPVVGVVPEAQETLSAPANSHVLTMHSLEERIRIRAYEIYLHRGGLGGSPEQDWFQAASEVYGESVA